MLVPITDRIEVANLKVQGKIVTIYFYDDNQHLHRAKFRSNNHSYLLLSLTFECPICFGEGINCDEDCIICGGIGWGAI